MISAALVMIALAQAPAEARAFSGTVVDADDRPAPGIEVLLSDARRSGRAFPGLSRSKADREGRFRIEVPAERDLARPDQVLALWAFSPEAELALLVFTPERLPAPGSVRLKLRRPTHEAVRVLGPDGKPVPGARVVPGRIRVNNGAGSAAVPPPDPLADLLAVTTDTNGNGKIRNCSGDELGIVSVEAPAFGLQRCELSAAADHVQVAKLKAAGRVSGRVQLDDRSAIKGLLVSVHTFSTESSGPQTSGEGYAATDAEGRFEIAALGAGQLYVNVVSTGNVVFRPRPPANLRVEPGQTTDVTIPLESPPPTRTVAGRVVDRSGKPVDGASVFQSGDSPARTETHTGADGRFRLNGIVARPTFLFARKPGYRFAGVAIAADANDVTVAIHRRDDPPRVTRKTLSPPLPRTEELALARRLVDPYAALVLKQGGNPEKVPTLEVLARIEPERVLELVQKKVFNIPFLDNMIGLRVATGMMVENVDDALAVLEGLDDPGAKAMGYLKAAKALGTPNRARALEVLDLALLNARAAKEPEGINLLLTGQVAEQLLDLGEAERGRTLLRAGEATAKQLPSVGWVGYARGAFAEELAQVDLTAALALTKDLGDAREFDRHHGNIAHELAGRDPAAAERVLAMIKAPAQRDQPAVRVTYRMAPLDLPRARRLAESITDDVLKGFALGMMALRLAEAGKDSARGVLDDAYDSLERSSRADRQRSMSLYVPATTAAVLLPVVEQIAPGLVDEYFWRCLAMRPPKPWEQTAGNRSAQTDALVAMMLARYDRAVARSLVEPFTATSTLAQDYFSRQREQFVAAAMIDPHWGVTLVEALPDDRDVKLQGTKNSARLAVTNVLSRSGTRRYRYLQSSFLYLWVPDAEDLDHDD
jgi:hypothetical protein